LINILLQAHNRYCEETYQKIIEEKSFASDMDQEGNWQYKPSVTLEEIAELAKEGTPKRLITILQQGYRYQSVLQLAVQKESGRTYLGLAHRNADQKLFLDESGKISEKLVAKFNKFIMNHICAEEKLPLNLRGSFGFAISNVVDCKEGIRFALGLEAKKILDKYVEIIVDVNKQLAKLNDDERLSKSLLTMLSRDEPWETMVKDYQAVAKGETIKITGPSPAAVRGTFKY
jgi:hypothetical protein